ncbi:Zn-dependent alcohol dehydrogenase GroES-like domain-containing protein (plasmid) [Rhizobium phaseoli]|nr:Zn-dependent alcohol dehydrogenase GroES-like domain-containing protein [Rhizobium phaseoli]
MKAMILEAVGSPLRPVERPDPVPGKGQLMLRMEACAVCRTDLHVCDGDLDSPKLPLVPGHEIVGIVEAVGEGIASSRIGQKVGVPWLGHTCGSCSFCRAGQENLCDRPQFTGYTRDGGFATHVVADAAYAFALDEQADPVALAPLLCAGLIGWRSLKKLATAPGLGSTGSVRPLISLRKSAAGRAVRSMRSQEQAMMRRAVLPSASAPSGQEALTKDRRSCSMRPSSSLRSERSCRRP